MEDYQAKAYNENAAIEMLQGVDGEIQGVSCRNGTSVVIGCAE